jgi:radical SAM superfamily enzyme YgiQ (UPF0313 family)
MKVFLIQPRCNAEFTEDVFMHEPLALEYLGAGLKQDGHEVAVFDARIDSDIVEALKQFKPRVAGITSYTNQVPIVKDIASRLKAINPGIFIVVGGHHATVRPEDFNELFIDLVVIGEGVGAIREIVARMERGRNFEDIKGLGIPGAEMRFTAKRLHPELDALPFPDRTLTEKYRNNYFNEWLKPLASIRTSLGCTSHCNFCALWAITDGTYLRRSPESVVEELRTIRETNVFFCDDESMCDIIRMKRLGDLIREAGIQKKFFLYARADTIVRHPELFRQWRDIGLTQVFVGMESFSDRHLESLNKGITTEQQTRATKILDELGVLLYANFIVDPAFNREDFRELVRYVRRLNLKYASFSVLTPLPGTALYEERESELLTKRPELFDFMHTVLPTTLQLKEFYAELAWLYGNALPFRHRLGMLRKYGGMRALKLLMKYPSAIAKIKKGYMDYVEGKKMKKGIASTNYVA